MEAEKNWYIALVLPEVKEIQVAHWQNSLFSELHRKMSSKGKIDKAVENGCLCFPEV